MFEKLTTYLKRRKKRSYTQLWEMLYGDGYGHDKGYIREYDFAMEAARGWRYSYDFLKDSIKNTEDLEKSAFDAGVEVERKRIIDLIRPLGCEGNGVEHDCNVPLKEYTANEIINLIRGEEEEYAYTWTLGDNLDCETCGPTWNEVGLELWDDEEGIWQLYIRVGCYEGDSVMSNDPEWGKKSAEIVEQATWYSGFSEDNLKELRERLALIKGENE